jgi:hypothetical protein
MFTHSMTSLLYWQKIYFSPGTTWMNPLHFGTLQESLDNQYTFVINVINVSFILFMLMIRFRRRIRHIVTFRSGDIK